MEPDETPDWPPDTAELVALPVELARLDPAVPDAAACGSAGAGAGSDFKAAALGAASGSGRSRVRRQPGRRQQAGTRTPLYCR